MASFQSNGGILPEGYDSFPKSKMHRPTKTEEDWKKKSPKEVVSILIKRLLADKNRMKDIALMTSIMGKINEEEGWALMRFHKMIEENALTKAREVCQIHHQPANEGMCCLSCHTRAIKEEVKFAVGKAREDFAKQLMDEISWGSIEYRLAVKQIIESKLSAQSPKEE